MSRFLIPLVLVAVMIPVFVIGLNRDPSEIPSPLLMKPAPEFELPSLKDPGRNVGSADYKGRLALLNVWATWCPTCKAEHDELMRIRATTDLRIVGVNYKDDPQRALRWLQEFGDPYEFNLLDLDGTLGVELGVYGAPESFLLDSEGTIIYKRVGEINQRIWQRELVPRLQVLEVLGDG